MHKNTTSDTRHLVNLLSSSRLLEEKVRVNLYLPKVFVQIMDAKAKSRSEYIKNMMIDYETPKTTPKKITKFDPYGMFKDKADKFDNIDQDIKNMWDESFKKVERQIAGRFD